ncbi:Peroxidase 2 [Vigna angularis]|uniref:peroxidase n=1 Tax=Phaseolus angularis TaxID=3914 RepID=A0A8T0K5X5_PHAAN|nr:Peroxidase 2 [Vigna angularis]
MFLLSLEDEEGGDGVGGPMLRWHLEIQIQMVWLGLGCHCGLEVQVENGPSWIVALGQRDATTASESAANAQLPSLFFDLPTLTSAFAAKGLSACDITVLSGGHNIGQAQCQLFRARIYNETNIDISFTESRRSIYPSSGGDTNLSPLDSLTPIRFDNKYFSELVAGRGLLISDQVLFDGGS